VTYVQDPRAALDAILAFPVAPHGYREDMVRCLGLSGESTTMDDIHDAAIRLVAGVLPLLQERAGDLRARLPDDLHGMLVDGTFERYVDYLMKEPAHE
jgi:phosphoribosyl-AMP cyclohydrolase